MTLEDTCRTENKRIVKLAAQVLAMPDGHAKLKAKEEIAGLVQDVMRRRIQTMYEFASVSEDINEQMMSRPRGGGPKKQYDTTVAHVDPSAYGALMHSHDGRQTS
jgi:hypothetical protein